MKTIGDTVEEIIKAGHYSTGTIIDKVAGYKVPPNFSPSLVNSLANTLAAACEKLDKSRARIEQLEAALRKIAESSTSDEHGAWMRAEGHAAEDDSNESCADWMEVHDRIILDARKALQ